MPIVEMLTKGGQRLLINARREATSIFADKSLILNFDREGRMIGTWIDQCNYHRTLDNRIIEKREGPIPGLSYRVRRQLPADEARAFQARVRGLVSQYREAAHDPHTQVVNGASAADRDLVLAALDEILGCDDGRLEHERELFHRIFKPITILPPDQYMALVLQVTEGCSYNKCSFCGFYRDRTFRIKSLDEFRRHLHEAYAFFGRAINLRKTIFLADANAIVIPQETLVPLFDVINSEFAVEPAGLDQRSRSNWRNEHPAYFEGIYSFIDAFTTRRKTAGEYADLRDRGLRRVYIGLESGDEGLLRFLGKPNTPQDTLNLVRELKQGGVAVGLVILAGAGGVQHSAEHVRETVKLVNDMALDGDDVIYLSELVDYPGSEYSALAGRAGIEPLTVEAINQQMQEIKRGLSFTRENSRPKVSFYDVRELTY